MKEPANSPINGTERFKEDRLKKSDHAQNLSSDDENIVDTNSLKPQYFTDLQWQKTVEKVVKSVVSIHFSQVEFFDTELPMCSEATGFVVDAKLGIILTNRHVVGPGPFVGYVVFDNHEEVDVKPIYRDPVHDFGFLQFNPKDIKYMKIDELELKPELAKVGCEIRVIVIQ
ncbi:unnamed protein product [Ambrosiozyma monospora]|uniref:Unnamed protein product n=1 Tax=Ambrosiozyma monospora TaxID=43982 RepID=A0A9W6T9F4_AMBMO|nr:unnamed protein product [Ambrosiozyma monospora]